MNIDGTHGFPPHVFETSAISFPRFTAVGRIVPGESLGPLQARVGPKGATTLVMEASGELVLYDNRDLASELTPRAFKPSPSTVNRHSSMDEIQREQASHRQRVIWSSRTRGAGPCRLLMGTDGNLTVRQLGPPNRVVWTSHTTGLGRCFAQLETEGDFRVYSGGGRLDPTIVWASETNNFDPQLVRRVRVFHVGMGGIRTALVKLAADGTVDAALEEERNIGTAKIGVSFRQWIRTKVPSLDDEALDWRVGVAIACDGDVRPTGIDASMHNDWKGGSQPRWRSEGYVPQRLCDMFGTAPSRTYGVRGASAQLMGCTPNGIRTPQPNALVFVVDKDIEATASTAESEPFVPFVQVDVYTQADRVPLVREPLDPPVFESTCPWLVYGEPGFEMLESDPIAFGKHFGGWLKRVVPRVLMPNGRPVPIKSVFLAGNVIHGIAKIQTPEVFKDGIGLVPGPKMWPIFAEAIVSVCGGAIADEDGNLVMAGGGPLKGTRIQIAPERSALLGAVRSLVQHTRVMTMAIIN